MLAIHLPTPQALLVATTLLLAACSQAIATPADIAPEETSSDPGAISWDAIPAIDNPEFESVAEANESYDEDELILGVEFNGDARAYSVPLLSSHEIVNDTVGGVKIAVTW
jgi:hypothetical protein